MRIKLNPQIPLEYVGPLVICLKQDTLTIDGEAFDFSPLSEGAQLPAEAVDPDRFTGMISRTNGEISLTLNLPIGPHASYEARFPEPLRITKDGPVELPGCNAEPRQNEVLANE